jgi:hypothetical protein
MPEHGTYLKRVLKNNLTAVQTQRVKSMVQRVAPAILPIIRRDLSMLALLCMTDKLEHGYIEPYSKHLHSRRADKLKILEIGVKDGASLRMWKNYFYRSKVYGIDIDDKSHLNEKRIKTFQGDQSDVQFLRRVAEEINDIDIVIDDGSHVSGHVVTSFTTLFPLLKNGGIYIIEDLQASYRPDLGGAWQNLDDPNTSMSMLKRLADGLNHPWIPNRFPSYTDQNILSLHFYPKMAIIYNGRNVAEISSIDRLRIEASVRESQDNVKDGYPFDPSTTA